jgi:hypothetical protein
VSVIGSLRARPEAIELCRSGGSGGSGASPCVSVRVEVPEVWDAVRVETPTSEPVLAIKTRALAVLFPDGGAPEEFVLKLNGFEILDEHASVSDVGAVDGSTFLLTSRRRRPVKS